MSCNLIGLRYLIDESNAAIFYLTRLRKYFDQI